MTARVPRGLRRTPAGPPATLTPRLFAALVAGKAAGTATRVLGRGGGTSLPGMVARRIDPTVLETIVRRRGVPVVAITGSNGKTTTARFTAALLRGEDVAASYHPAGANLVQSVTSLAVNFADLRGKLPAGVLVAEVDEGALPHVAPELAPRVVLVTDLFRDQLDRFGELYAVADAIESVARGLPPEAALVSNADDPLVANMAPAIAARRVTFGFELGHDTDRITRAADTIRCPRCRADLEYRHVYLSHMGDYRCPACSFARPTPDVAVTSVEVEGIGSTRFSVRLPSGATLDVRVPQAGIHIAYDGAAAIAALVALGVEPEHAAASLAAVGPAFGRLEQIQAGDKRVILGFAKNPTSFNANLRALATEGEPRQLLVAASNTLVDGEDFAWLWDVDFESAASQVQRATVSGTRADELANRLKYAGVDPGRMTVVEDRRLALDAALDAVGPGGTLTILAGYTPTIELREEMHRRGWVGRYWQA
ncbi:MAG TPA: MurT ligase domain-containing protein [Candidatus Limnocylindrales bacterium]